MINDVLPPKATPKQNQTPNNDRSPVFKTPEQVAAAAVVPVAPSAPPVDIGGSFTPPPKPRRMRIDFRSRKTQIIIAAVIAALLIGGVAAWFVLKPSKQVVVKKVAVVQKKPAVVKPTTVPSNLSGLPVDPAVNNTPVTGVMIENSTFARPQSGLAAASIVFEAIAEGGITRFLALYQDTAPANVGPIRSVRPYYEQWALGFNAAIAHVGGSPEALANIKLWGVRDLDQFYNSGSYHRVNTREAPHNVYTGIPTLVQLQVAKGFTTSTFTSLPRKADSPVKPPTANTISLTLSGPLYNTAYAYDATSNSYKRSVGGAPHTDAETNAQLSPKVVVALVMPYSIASDGKHSVYGTIGSGQAYVFQDGGVTIGTWTKASNNEQIVLTDANAQTLKLNAGQTWITAVSKPTNVTYSP